MTGDEAVQLNATLQRIWRLCGRRPLNEAEVHFWIHELRSFPARDVFGALALWERTNDEEHPPTLKSILRACAAKEAARSAARELRITSLKYATSTPNSRAFAAMWQATAGDPSRFTSWCRSILESGTAAAEQREFATDVLDRIGALQTRPRPTVQGFTRVGAALAAPPLSEDELEARREREAIQAEASMG